MKSISSFSFVSEAEKLTLLAYTELPIVINQVVSRIAAIALLSLAAALDIVFHGLMLLPTFIYASGKWIFLGEKDFSLPCSHLQRMRNAMAPLLLGSALGALHPFAGLAVSEPTDKHILTGMLASNTGKSFETPCSPVHSLSLIADLAENHQYAEDEEKNKVEIFSPEHVKVIRSAGSFEKSLESLQAQEYLHKITNITLYLMAMLNEAIVRSSLNRTVKEILLRVTGILIPILSVIDMTIALIVQAVFLITGVVRMLSGRGPIYTEVTINPLMQLAFLLQNILKTVGILVGTLVWFVDPLTGFKVSVTPSHFFFDLQMKLLMRSIRSKMEALEENERFVIPIVYGEGPVSALSVPTHSMHKTYLILEKEKGLLNLYWVNRPDVSLKKQLDAKAAEEQIKLMFNERFPFMDTAKLMEYPVQSKKPQFEKSEPYATLKGQGSSTNCVVSNLFGMLETLDKLKGAPESVTKLRYKVVRQTLMEDYYFYENTFFPFTGLSEGYSLSETWKDLKNYPAAAI